MEDCTRGIMTISEYDALNHLIRQEISKAAFPEDAIQKTYTYDKRGSLTGEYQDGELLHGYAYNSMNRLEKAWDSEGKEAEYFYNALGQRTARSTAAETEEYLLDLTKPYHNLLERQKGKHSQTFYWDMNVSAMEDENRTLQYYLQDELGSPLRVLYRSGSGAAYGYDEFGADLYDPEKKTCAGRQYSRQGEHQPFGFTGYRYDDISGTYFAQAREYQPGEGRFTAEDVLRGRNSIPKTLNRYGYCWGNPIQYVDVNGENPVAIAILLGLAVVLAVGTTGCSSKIKEEDILPLPTTTSDYVYQHDIDEYNTKEYKSRTNCYAYALDIVENPLTGEQFNKCDGSFNWAAQPGMFSPDQPFAADTTEQKYINLITNDVEQLGWSIQPYNKDLTGGYIIALALDLNFEIPDYHFYRENGDGTWSCKWGNKGAVTGVENPQIDAFKHKYTIFCGYYYIIKLPVYFK